MLVIAYLCYAIFLWRMIWRIFLLLNVPKDHGELLSPPGITMMTMLKAIRDILFLTRLFRVNKLLWIGEWLFHWSFLFVLLRHLRYFFYPVPGWVLSLQSVGIFAGYILHLSLIYILIAKLKIEKRGYFSTYNFFLLILLITISLTGILMKNVIRPDIVEIKYFMLNMLMFEPVSIPASMLFNIHFNTTLVFLVSLPTHIFAAPYTLLQARKREDRFDFVIHEK